MESQRQLEQAASKDFEQQFAEFREVFRKYGVGIGVIAGVVLGAIAVMGFVRGRDRFALERSWTDYFDAAFSSNTDQSGQLQRIASQAGGTPVQAESLILAGNLLLGEAVPLLFSDREDAIAKCNEAINLLTRAASFASNDFHGQRDRALISLASAQESIGKISEAIQTYTIVADANQKPYGPIAKQRIAALGKPGAADFYNWLAEFKPPAPVANPGAKLPPLPGSDQLPSPLGSLVPDLTPSGTSQKGAGPLGGLDLAPSPDPLSLPAGSPLEGGVGETTTPNTTESNAAGAGTNADSAESSQPAGESPKEGEASGGEAATNEPPAAPEMATPGAGTPPTDNVPPS